MLGEGETFRVYLRTESGTVGRDKSVYMDLKQSTDFKKFLKLSGKKLKMKAVKCYNANTSQEILNLDEVKADDVVIITSGKSISPPANGLNTSQETMFVSVLGAGGVGKSAITLRFVRDFFVNNWDPTIEDAYRKAVDVDNKLCILDILDTAGQDEFESLRAQWMMDKDGYILVYSMKSRTSFEELTPFFKLHKQINESRSSEKHVPIILVANKKDIVDSDSKSRQVSQSEGMEFAAKHGAIYCEASAVTGENVVGIFETFIREVRKINLPQKKDTIRQCCCIL